MSILLTMGIGAALGGANAIMQNRAMAKAQREQIMLNRQAAIYAYNSAEDSINLMKSVNRELTQNAIAEQLRAGSENVRQTQQQVQKVASQVGASSEGLTSGKSKGRELASLYIQGNKLLDSVKDNAIMNINKLVDMQDKKTNEFNNYLLKQYQEMSSVLANEGPEIPGNINRVFQGMFQGAQLGANLGSSYKMYNEAPTIPTIQLPQGYKGRNPTI